MYTPPKRVIATVSQSGTDAPTWDIQRNDIEPVVNPDDKDLEWQYDDAGAFTLLSHKGSFTDGKTSCTLQTTNEDITRVNLQNTPGQINFQTLQILSDPEDNHVIIQGTNDIMTKATLIIEVQP